MKITPKDFQDDYVAELREKFTIVQSLADKGPSAALLNAPTGSGKTLMATALIEALLEGSEDVEADPELVFLWLTDQPELNKQTYDKMLDTSSVLTRDDLVIIDAGVDIETFAPGKVYFLNTQKLGAKTGYVKTGDGRTFTLWETISNTIERNPRKFVLIVDEAHRGTQGKEALEAETIMQKFLKGSPGEIPAVPLVIGISATPDRFAALCTETARPLFRVDVDPERVRESGLLKEFVDLYHPDEKQPSHVTMLVRAAGDWKRYRDDWAAYGTAEKERVPTPVMLVQVEDATAKSSALSKTDLPTVLSTLAAELGDETTEGWIAHAFQDDTDTSIAGHAVRHISPSMIDSDDRVKVVLFKTSLNTGWDCPRAEVMVSFRTAKDETNIAQLVGRMVRAPLARRIDSNEHLNTVALYLPFYDRKQVQKVIKRLTGDPGTVPPTGVREGKDAVTLYRADELNECFRVLARLPTYNVPKVRPVKPVARLGRLAALLAECGLEADPVSEYRTELVAVLEAERLRLSNDDEFKHVMEEADVLDLRRQRIAYGGPDGEVAVESSSRIRIAEQNVDDLYNEAGRKLGEGLHKEYLRTRIEGGTNARDAKLELHALVTTNGTLTKVQSAADKRRREWVAHHKAAFAGMEEKYRQALRTIEGAGSESEELTIEPPPSIEWTKADQGWPRHLYVESDGTFRADFKSSWERRVVEAELAREGEVIGWLRNPDRKVWSLCVTRQEGTRWIPFYPDFIFFRTTGSGVIADIVDPHLLSAEDMPQRAVALAQFAQKHSDRFGRIEMVIYDGPNDNNGRRIDLASDEALRNKVAAVTTTPQLKQIFADQGK